MALSFSFSSSMQCSISTSLLSSALMNACRCCSDWLLPSGCENSSSRRGYFFKSGRLGCV